MMLHIRKLVWATCGFERCQGLLALRAIHRISGFTMDHWLHASALNTEDLASNGNRFRSATAMQLVVPSLAIQTHDRQRKGSRNHIGRL
jgi:hypothetical protein